MQIKAVFHILKHSTFLLRHPRAFIRACGELFRTIILKQDRLRVVEWVVTDRCNSKCVMCYATKYSDPAGSPLTISEVKSVWRECEKQGAFISILEGGEPTLREDIEELLKAMNPERNIVVLVSNSLSLTEESTRYYKRIGVSVLHLSLDGANPELNDGVRGISGHFNKVMQCVEWAKKAGLEVYFSSVLKGTNKKEYEDILKLARRLGIGVSGALLVAQGRYEKRSDERLTEEDRKWLMGYLLKEYSDVLRFDWNTNFSGKYECPAGREKISISLYGEVMACVCNHLSFGNVRKEPLGVILKRMNNFSYFRKRNERCLVGFDTEYRRRYMEPIRDSAKLPVDIFEHPTDPAKLAKGSIIE